MKKAFGVMILAGLPVACGTTLPSSPEATAPEAAPTSAASVGAQSRRMVPVPAPETLCAPVDENGVVAGIRVAVVARGRGWVRLGTKVATISNPRTEPPSCFQMTWSAGVAGDRLTLTPSADTQEATLSAAPGRRFEVTSTIESATNDVIGRTSVSIE